MRADISIWNPDWGSSFDVGCPEKETWRFVPQAAGLGRDGCDPGTLGVLDIQSAAPELESASIAQLG